MDSPVIHSLSLCSGVGMLDEGVRAGLEYLGVGHRAVAYVEREAAAASRLLDRMEEGAVDAAPIWSGNLERFNSRPFRDVVDLVVAGFPCQPHSVAGRRKGTGDERWIWPDIARIIRVLSPRLVFLENVRGLLSSGGFEAVLGSLAHLGFHAEWGVLSASEVGASHKRERVFILAYRDGELLNRSRDARARRRAEPEKQGSDVAYAARHERSGSHGQNRSRRRVREAGGQLVNAESNGRRERRAEHEFRGGRNSPSGAVGTLGDPAGAGPFPSALSGLHCLEKSGRPWHGEPGRPSCEVADTQRDRHQGAVNAVTGKGATGNERRFTDPGLPIFAPGPLDPRWAGIVSDYPHLAPAVEPDICFVADGVAYLVDEFRADQLRAIGNGVVAAQAAAAFVLLARRAGII